MATFKKKDIKNLKDDSEKIEELIDADGSPIEGDEVHNNDSEIEVPNAQTSDEFKSQAIGPRSYYNLYGGTPYSRGSRHGMTVENIDEIAKDKMKKMVEDVLSKQNGNAGMVNRRNISDIDRDGIPDLEELSNTKPMIDRELKKFINMISRIQLTGEEKGIVLNNLLQNMNIEDIPNDYKRFLAQNLK